LLQLPEPSQLPVRQLPVQAVSEALAAFAEQVPWPFRLHAMQGRHEDVEQQTPSTQFPLSQSEAALQVGPSAFFVPQISPVPAQT
jgi:hypothetical protein